jgi:hypothetical protein
MTRLLLVALVSAISALAACTGTDTGNPPVTGNPPGVGFASSGCKKASLGALQSVDKANPDPRYEGLTCLAFQHLDDNTIRIDLTNYESGCESDKGWTPRAQQRADGGLDIILQDADCSQAKCGFCLYDLAFTVPLELGIEDGEVHVYQQGCDGVEPHEKWATLAVSSQNSGAACNYANRNALSWQGAGTAGSKRMPCSTSASSSPVPSVCQSGLVCSDLGESVPVEAANGGTRCLPSCRADADCDELTSCQEGECKLKARELMSR